MGGSQGQAELRYLRNTGATMVTLTIMRVALEGRGRHFSPGGRR